MTALAPTLQSFVTSYLIGQRLENAFEADFEVDG